MEQAQFTPASLLRLVCKHRWTRRVNTLQQSMAWIVCCDVTAMLPGRINGAETEENFSPRDAGEDKNVVRICEGAVFCT